MIIRLQHQRSDGENDIYHLKSGHRYHLGRGSACEVRILDLKLSRKHCAIEYTEGEWRVIDLASTNGCKVDGDQIVGSVALKTGTQIEIGQSVLKVVRILGDEESEDLDGAPAATPELAANATAPPAASIPTPVPPPPPPAKASEGEPARRAQAPTPLKTPAPLEQLNLDDEGEEPHATPSLEHSATDWEPEPAPEAATKGGALVPNPSDTPGGLTDRALAKSRSAAEGVAQQASSHTGEIQRPGGLGRSPAKILPKPAELESGGYSTLEQPELAEPSAVSPKSDKILPPTPPAPPTPVAPRTEGKAPGTETRRRQQIMPVIVQPMSAAEIDAAAASGATVPTFLAMPRPAVAAPAPTPPPPPPPRPPPPRIAPTPTPMPTPSVGTVVPAKATTPTPISTPASTAPDAKADADRTFFITVLGRRIGPLTRLAARDLKSRELRGTLTFKDLDQYS